MQGENQCGGESYDCVRVSVVCRLAEKQSVAKHFMMSKESFS